MTYSGYTDAQKRATEKYLSNKVDSIMTRAPKGKKAELQAIADQQGISLNAYMNKLIDYALQHPDIIK